MFGVLKRFWDYLTAGETFWGKVEHGIIILAIVGAFSWAGYEKAKEHRLINANKDFFYCVGIGLSFEFCKFTYLAENIRIEVKK